MLGIRVWDKGKMIYPKKFSVILDYAKSETSIKIQDKKNYGIITTKPMYLTPGMAINGEIYELDILADSNGNVGVVRFSEKNGSYYVNMNNKNVQIKRDMYDYEIIGNAYENKDHIKVFTKNHNQVSVGSDKLNLNGKNEEKNNNTDEDKDLKNKLTTKEEKTTDKVDKKEKAIEKQEEEHVSLNAKAEEKGKGTDLGKENSVEKEKNTVINSSLELPVVDIYSYASQNSVASYIMKSKDIERTDVKTFKTDRLLSEIEMIILAISALKSKCKINIHATNKLILAPFERGWIDTWAKNEWKKANGEKVKNKDYWERLYKALNQHEYDISYIEPGSSIVEVLRCIDMCKEGVKNDK